MGIPGPNASVPTDIPSEELCCLKRKYNNGNGMDERATFQTLVRGSLPELEFKQLFLLYSLGVLLCPTQSCRISPMHLKVLHVAGDAQKFNWCGYVFDWLVGCARRFKNSKSKSGGFGGCAVFLMIFYLNRINIGNPVNWSTCASRVDAWDPHMLRSVIQQDRKTTWDFGRAEYVVNVIYGAEYPIGTARVRWEEIRAQQHSIAESVEEIEDGEQS